MNEDHLDVKTPEYVSIQFQLAGLGSRAAAFIIDQVLLMIINILTIAVLYFVMDGMSSMPFFLVDSSIPIAIAIIILFIVNGGYFFAFEFFSGGRTLGKKLVGIRVIQENGHSITLLSSFIRNLIRIIDSLPTAYFLGIVMIFFHSKHKRLGDLVAGTIVVHERKPKRKKKLSSIEKEIENRGLSKNDLTLDEWTLKSLGMKEWKLLSTYASRFHQIPLDERNHLTKQIAEILLPKIGMDVQGKLESEKEDTLLILYLLLREEWEFEL
ncbi:RDD domain containing protein [Neobacillus bataviensis LMG 21833]|uniref:RDD domain containing protein n=1 Tax=Neobacillus bataviensis LMG 21833 TaxID=1117379 RepID=K6DBM3_9BACI|nr:RDD family protein [Neobacillus bataviensis]EKN65463.1 RDD domain containing protein [Neobacillus bataviensis LMG 21833]